MKSFKEYLEVIQESIEDYERRGLGKLGKKVPESLYTGIINNLTDDQFKEVTEFIDFQLKNQTSDFSMRNLYLLIKKLKQSSKKVDPARKSTLEQYSKKVLDKMTALIHQSLEKDRYDLDDEGLGDFIKVEDYK